MLYVPFVPKPTIIILGEFRRDENMFAGTKTQNIEKRSAESKVAPRHHVVKKGESLSQIAKRYKLPLRSLIEANKKQIGNPDLIHPGQKIQLPKLKVTSTVIPAPTLANSSLPAKEKHLSRGLRLNNPGNIRYNSLNNWHGQSKKPMDDQGYCRFEKPEFGIRAMCKILASYQGRGISTIRKTINTWAPPADNNPTDRYIDFVCKKSGLSANDTLNLDNREELGKVIKAIILFENGRNPYPESVINSGIKKAFETAR